MGVTMMTAASIIPCRTHCKASATVQADCKCRDVLSLGLSADQDYKVKGHFLNHLPNSPENTQTRLLMAALIIAIRTAHIESSKFCGMTTPQVASEVASGLFLANLICDRAVDRYPEWWPPREAPKPSASDLNQTKDA
jgi:hypothetical protein